MGGLSGGWVSEGTLPLQQGVVGSGKLYVGLILASQWAVPLKSMKACKL